MRLPTVLPIAAAVLLAGAAVAQTMAPPTSSTAAAAEQARALIGDFMTTLQGELKSGLQEGGPPAAVRVCEDVAPTIAGSLSDQSGWQVGRTSLKTRNLDNAPDPWEEQVLEQFKDRKTAGQPVSDMTYAAVVEEDGIKTYRFMKAIPTQEVCLACHGKNLSPELVEVLDKLYPEDQARGYEVGDIRGAFTLSKPL